MRNHLYIFLVPSLSCHAACMKRICTFKGLNTQAGCIHMDVLFQLDFPTTVLLWASTHLTLVHFPAFPLLCSFLKCALLWYSLKDDCDFIADISLQLPCLVFGWWFAPWNCCYQMNWRRGNLLVFLGYRACAWEKCIGPIHSNNPYPSLYPLHYHPGTKAASRRTEILAQRRE